MKYRFLTSGESHGKCLNAIIEGMPSGIKIDKEFINSELNRRQKGYGRGGRMDIETDTIEINSGVRFGYSTGAPICIEIKNKDYENWLIPMSVDEMDLSNSETVNKIEEKKITKLRPGHADFAGAIKYGHSDVRNVLERSSARETAARVVVGAVAKCLLKEFDIKVFSHVIQIGQEKVSTDYRTVEIQEFIEKVASSELFCYDKNAELRMKKLIDEAKDTGTTLGGKIEIICRNIPVGLGSYVHWDRKLDGLFAQALMSINGIKSVEIGDVQKALNSFGKDYHDEIFYNNGFGHKTNNAGGIEGGMSNGKDIVLKIVMKPIPTMRTGLNSVDLITKEPYKAHFERSDVCAVPACAVVGEAMCSIVLVNELLIKFGGDSLSEIMTRYDNISGGILSND